MTRRVSNNNQPKMFVPSDHMKSEGKFWTRLAVGGTIALVLCGYAISAYFDGQALDMVLQIGMK